MLAEACDIYGAGGTPCVAAYSTVRALYGAYSGNLYQVRRADNTTMDIGVLSAGGVANAAAQDTFCANTSCTISILYDQSGKGNDLTKGPGATNNGPNTAPDVEADAAALPIMIAGHKAYGIHMNGNQSRPIGYRNDATTGVATGDAPESIYMVTDGTFYNGGCCFDFGNVEGRALYDGGPVGPDIPGKNGMMEAIYFGNVTIWDKGAGSGPWVMVDLENGIFNEGGNSGMTNNADVSLPYPFVTAVLKGDSVQANPGGRLTLESGNAQMGKLGVVYDGVRPSGYAPAIKGGGIVVGIGGDNSASGQGNFFEGVLTAGYATSTTDDAVQANIVAAGYGK